MAGRFTAAHRGGRGTPLVCLHGFLDTWRVWELVLPALERRHEVLAPTLAGHAGGPAIEGSLSEGTLVDFAERAMDEAGFETAHIAGNSLGGYIALQLAERGRARSVVALAPAGGWAADDPARARLLAFQRELHALVAQSAQYADALVSTADGRRRATALTTVNYEHIPPALLADQIRWIAACQAAPALLDYAEGAHWELDPERITCPVRVVWGTADRLLQWPSAAVRYREWLPNADWVELDDVGHCPQLDVPLVTSELVLGFSLE